MRKNKSLNVLSYLVLYASFMEDGVGLQVLFLMFFFSPIITIGMILYFLKRGNRESLTPLSEKNRLAKRPVFRKRN